MCENAEAGAHDNHGAHRLRLPGPPKWLALITDYRRMWTGSGCVLGCIVDVDVSGCVGIVRREAVKRCVTIRKIG